MENDGFFFVHSEEGGYDLHLFNYLDTVSKTSIEGSDLGDRYHVAFFYDDEEGVIFDEKFDAIFIDPLTYIKRLTGSKYYGIVARKTENSSEWFDNAIDAILKRAKDYGKKSV